MIVLVCEGSLDMEFFAILLEQIGFERLKVGEDFIWKRLGLRYRWFRVLRRGEVEIIVFYPKSGGYKVVIETAKEVSQQKVWKSRGVEKVLLAIDLDEKSVEERVKAVEDALKSVYSVERIGKFSFKCEHDEETFFFTVVPIGDPDLSMSISQGKHTIEDLILASIIEDERLRNICEQRIELFEHKEGRKPDQKSLLRMLEAFCKDPERGIFEILSNIQIKIPTHVKDSLNEGLKV